MATATKTASVSLRLTEVEAQGLADYLGGATPARLDGLGIWEVYDELRKIYAPF